MSSFPRPGLVVDRYHLDSAYVSWKSGQNATATFDLYTRSHPFGGGWLLLAGLEQAVDFARRFSYDDQELGFVDEMSDYEPDFLDALRRLRFTGEISAMAEGDIAFPGEPLLRVTAPFREALLLESGLLHLVGVATLIATKAARICQAARDRPVAEFALRRAQDPFTATRSAWIAGCASTSFVAGARRWGIPAGGTIPHSLVQAYETEEEAFAAVASTLPRYALLLDTYDVARAIDIAVRVALDARKRYGHELTAVRLDSGDLAADARLCRRVLDEAGLGDTKIFASGDLDESRIASLVACGTPIDAFGVGTSLGVGTGDPGSGNPGASLGVVYKLVWYEGGAPRARIKIAEDKSTWPGRKQVWRLAGDAGDLIALEDEPAPANATPMLRSIMRDGATVPGELRSLSGAREAAGRNLAALPERHRRLSDPEPYPIAFSPRLRELRAVAMRHPGWQSDRGPDHTGRAGA